MARLMRTWFGAALFLSAATLLGGGCNLLLDIDDVAFADGPVTAVGGSGGHGAQGGSGGQGAKGGSGGIGGAGGSGGVGGGIGDCAGEPASTPCGDPTDNECTDPDTCDDAEVCLPNHAPVDAPCGDDTDTDCNLADTCNGTGACLDNLEPAGTSCGSSTDPDCSDPNTCDGTGTCLANDKPGGTACGDPSDTDCTSPDTCSSSAACLSHDATDGTSCTDCTIAPCAPCAFGYCPSVGQSYLDIGSFERSYDNNGHSRGYWFTAPVAFTMVGLRVPLDVGTAAQNIQVVRLNVEPPVYAATTTDFTTLEYQAGVAGTGFIPVNVAVLAGEIIGVLGTRGTSQMHNAYATSNTYDTTLLGQPVTLNRLRADSNLNAGAATELSAQNSRYARIEMLYTT